MSYFNAAWKEIEEKAKKYKGERIESIYFGGGTPTAVSESYIVKTLELIKELFEVDENAEITIEANPKTFDEEKLCALKKVGFNRISIGVQSFFDEDLKKLGRIHDGDTAVKSVKEAKRYFDNVSIDLMLGLEGQTKQKVKENLDIAINLGVSHISAYMLIIEDGTILKNLVDEGKYLPLSDDDSAEIYDYANNYLAENGYYRYEVSNFAIDRSMSKHNMGYWQMKNYVGIGLSAHSLVRMRRFYNTSSLDEYIEDPTNELSEENLSEKDFEEEYVMLSLRTKQGIDLIDYKDRFNKNFLTEKKETLERLKNFFDISQNSLSIKDEYFSVGSLLTAELLD